MYKRQTGSEPGERPPGTSAFVNNLGLALWYQGDAAAAEPLLREAVELRRAELGDDHPDTLVTQGNLGRFLVDGNRCGEAESILEEACDVASWSLAPDSFYLGFLQVVLGRCRTCLGEYDLAEESLREARALFESQLGAGPHPYLEDCDQALADVQRLRQAAAADG